MPLDSLGTDLRSHPLDLSFRDHCKRHEAEVLLHILCRLDGIIHQISHCQNRHYEQHQEQRADHRVLGQTGRTLVLRNDGVLCNVWLGSIHQFRQLFLCLVGNVVGDVLRLHRILTGYTDLDNSGVGYYRQIQHPQQFLIVIVQIQIVDGLLQDRSGFDQFHVVLRQGFSYIQVGQVHHRSTGRRYHIHGGRRRVLGDDQKVCHATRNHCAHNKRRNDQDDLASVVVEQIQKVYLDLTIFLVH